MKKTFNALAVLSICALISACGSDSGKGDGSATSNAINYGSVPTATAQELSELQGWVDSDSFVHPYVGGQDSNPQTFGYRNHTYRFDKLTAGFVEDGCDILFWNTDCITTTDTQTNYRSVNVVVANDNSSVTSTFSQAAPGGIGPVAYDFTSREQLRSYIRNTILADGNVTVRSLPLGTVWQYAQLSHAIGGRGYNGQVYEIVRYGLGGGIQPVPTRVTYISFDLPLEANPITDMQSDFQGQGGGITKKLNFNFSIQ